MQRKNNVVFLVLIIVIMVSAMIVLSRNTTTQAQDYVYSDIAEQFESENVDSFVLSDTKLTLTLKNPDEDGNTTEVYRIVSFSVFYNDFNDTVVEQYQRGIIKSYDYPEVSSTPWWIMFIPYLIIALIIFGLWMFMLSRANGGGQDRSVMKFTKAKTTVGIREEDRVTFQDVAGADEEKAELQEIVDFLRSPEKYTSLGAKIPKGVLLVGPPGTGKTLLAKAVAGEAGVQFFSISGSDFVELYVGVGASRVRDLFEQAKKQAPSIIFIDEIDAVGRQRGAGLGGGHDEREQTLNQMLVEMDGFNSNSGVVVMAATNRVDILDTALLRPGRFDRQVYVGAPDAKGREAILKVHSRNKPLADDVRLDVIAKETSGFTGADLQNLLNEAALRAAKMNRPAIMMEDIQESMIKVIAGPEKKSRVISDHEKKLTAFHEAGHAVVMHLLPTHDDVHQITIVPRGQAGGMTISLPTEDHSYMSRNEMSEQIIALLGGRIAESLVLGDISTGASNDLQRASQLARSMVAKYGMSDSLGAVVYDTDQEVFVGRTYGQTKNYSEEYASKIDVAVEQIIHEAYARCEELLNTHMTELHKVAEFLIEHETMSAEEFRVMMDGVPDCAPDAPAQISAEAEDAAHAPAAASDSLPAAPAPGDQA